MRLFPDSAVSQVEPSVFLQKEQLFGALELWPSSFPPVLPQLGLPLPLVLPPPRPSFTAVSN